MVKFENDGGSLRKGKNMSDSKKDFSLKGLFTEIPAEFVGFFENGSEIRPWYFLGEILKQGVLALILKEIEAVKLNPEFRKVYGTSIETKGEVWAHDSVVIEPWVKIKGPVIIKNGAIIRSFSYIDGPTLIGENTEVRPHANIRGYVATGSGCVIGHTTEVIRSILFNNVRADHFNYIGDSILGNGVHFGAGAITANLKLNEKPVVVKVDGVEIETAMKKFGAVLGDNCQVGCNAVVGPGAVFTKGTWYYLPGPTEGIFSREDFKK